uniref:Uncharacterized protein n=1 Tax=Amphimedon queenslandica TaxID=400682 RepID=A0A1X7TGX1_AMPQE
MMRIVGGGDCDELDHLDEAVTKSRSSFKTLFNKGVEYQAYLNRVVGPEPDKSGSSLERELTDKTGRRTDGAGVTPIQEAGVDGHRVVEIRRFST